MIGRASPEESKGIKGLNEIIKPNYHGETAAADRASDSKRYEWMQLAVAKWVLGLLSSEELPKIATYALDTGMDTPALRQLAGELRPVMADVGPILTKHSANLAVRSRRNPRPA